MLYFRNKYIRRCGTLPSWLRAEGGRSKQGALPVDPFNASDQEKQD